MPNNDHTGEKSEQNGDDQPAVELIRAKLNRIYDGEPDAETELAEADAEPPRELSKHQKFMLELQDSGKSIVEIQTAWHDYYNNLSDDEKREVWQEFYERQSVAKNGGFKKPSPRPEATPTPAGKSPEPANEATVEPETQDKSHEMVISAQPKLPPKTPRRRRPKPKLAEKASQLAKIRNNIRSETAQRAAYEKKQQRAKHNLQSLAFGLAIGFVVVIIFMFSFFNERFIAPFISPAAAAATPIILDPTAASPTKHPEIIIPKINVEIPLVFDIGTTNESKIEQGLENGVVHYPTTVLPGQKGNSAFFGHSSNNIFAPGHYKFAFTLLHELNKGDVFYITYDKKVFVYKVYDKQVVAPTAVEVLNNVPGKTATATLITCDPPGTSLNRLVVWGEQISPNPLKNSHISTPKTNQEPSQIVGNGPSLWDRIWPF